MRSMNFSSLHCSFGTIRLIVFSKPFATLLFGSVLDFSLFHFQQTINTRRSSSTGVFLNSWSRLYLWSNVARLSALPPLNDKIMSHPQYSHLPSAFRNNLARFCFVKAIIIILFYCYRAKWGRGIIG